MYVRPQDVQAIYEKVIEAVEYMKRISESAIKLIDRSTVTYKLILFALNEL